MARAYFEPVPEVPDGLTTGNRLSARPWRHRRDVRRARLHLSTAGNMLDCAATAITRARELAAEGDGAGAQLAEDVAAVRSSARMLVDVLSE